MLIQEAPNEDNTHYTSPSASQPVTADLDHPLRDEGRHKGGIEKEETRDNERDVEKG